MKTVITMSDVGNDDDEDKWQNHLEGTSLHMESCHHGSENAPFVAAFILPKALSLPKALPKYVASFWYVGWVWWLTPL